MELAAQSSSGIALSPCIHYHKLLHILISPEQLIACKSPTSRITCIVLRFPYIPHWHHLYQAIIPPPVGPTDKNSYMQRDRVIARRSHRDTQRRRHPETETETETQTQMHTDAHTSTHGHTQIHTNTHRHT